MNRFMWSLIFGLILVYIAGCSASNNNSNIDPADGDQPTRDGDLENVDDVDGDYLLAGRRARKTAPLGGVKKRVK